MTERQKEQLKSESEFRRDPVLNDEFQGNYEVYRAYISATNEGLVKTAPANRR
ncbi:hypothetical protein MTBBW1_2620012 [Desulfamplus magnetovallimortis]|uniref:Uncharacterized protein n=1 Tax=Desulfamplus magnetovallimortis TaxID=1246637 RepID=A0A1W1HF72_9BACT|nr:hypothetical protein [Desulfamplus magnetovallimortis]SLM31048.1 hypothetical protein MTBBW1_2620012 [Desulfamplus magnetovallimortis]